MDPEVEEGSGGDAADVQSAPEGLTRDEYHARERAAFLAANADDIAATEDGPPAGDTPATKPTGPAAKPAAPAVVIDDGDDDLEVPTGADLAIDDDDDDDDAEGGDASPADAQDAETAKRMAAVRRTEQRHREVLARDRAAFEAERNAWRSEAGKVVEAQQRFERLAARVKYDSAAVLLELGVPPQDLALHAHHLYSRSTDASVKPEHRAAADRALRERELADDLAATKKKQADLEEKLTAREQQAQQDQELEVYLGRVAKTVTKLPEEAAPRTRALLAANPARAREELAMTAFTLAKKLGGLPTPAQVAAANEKRLVSKRASLARQLAELDAIEPAGAAAGGASKPNKPQAPAAKTGKPSTPAANKTNGTHVASETGNGAKFPTRADMIRELEELDRAQAAAAE